MSYKEKIMNNTWFSALAVYQEYVVGLIISIIIARTLGAEEYGKYSLLLWIALLGIELTYGGVGISIIKYLAEVRGKGKNILVNSVLRFHMKLMYIKFPFFIAFASVLIYFFSQKLDLNENEFLVWFAVASALPRSIQLFYISVTKGMESFSTQYLINLIVTPINLALVAMAAILYGGLREFFYVYIVMGVVYYVVASRLGKRLVKTETDGADDEPLEAAYQNQIKRNVRILSLSVIFTFIVSRQLEVAMLNFFSYPEAAGFYNVAYVLAMAAIFLAPGVFGNVLLPAMARSNSEIENVQAYRFAEANRFLVMLIAPVVVFCVAFSSEIIQGLYGEAYAASALPFAIILLASSVTILTQSSNSVLLSHNRQGLILKLGIVAAVGNILINYYLIARFALYGAVAGFVITQLLLSFFLIRAAAKQLDTRVEYSRFLKFFVTAIVVMVPCWIIAGNSESIVLVLLVGVVYALSYFVAIVYFRQLKSRDLVLMRSLLGKIPVVSEQGKEKMMGWVEARYAQG